MKKNNYSKIILFLSLILIFLLTSCVTNKTVEKKQSEDFIADFDAFYLDDLFCLTETTFGNTKPAKISLYFNPRKSTIESRFKDGLNNVCLIWTKKEQQVLMDSIIEYMNQYNSGKKLENRKPTKKNSFFNSVIEIYWGITGYTRNTNANYYTNYVYLEENKPYFYLTVLATPYPEEKDVSSPTIRLYFTPSQLEKLVEITDYDMIMERINQMQEEAYSW